jgi:hypothetical protein
MDTDVWRFLCGCAGGKTPEHLFAACEFIKDAEGGALNSLYTVFHQGKWFTYDTKPAWSTIAMSAVLERETSGWVVVALGQGGQTWEMRPLERTEAVFPLGIVGLTNLATIGGSVYACGMGRVVWRRDAPGRWQELSAPWPDQSEGVIGFTDMAGLEEALLYAVGWQGEIWTRSGNAWRAENTPTNANLNAIALADDGIAYIVGDDGVMMKGRAGRWDAIVTGVDFNLQDVCVYEGEVFACTDFDVYRLTDAGLVSELEAADDSPETCLKLVPAKGTGVFSVGPYDVFLRSAGTWSRLA